MSEEKKVPEKADIELQKQASMIYGRVVDSDKKGEINYEKKAVTSVILVAVFIAVIAVMAFLLR